VLIEKQIHPTAGKLFNYVHKDLLNKRLEVFDTFRNEKLKTAELIYETIRNTNEFTELEIILITGRYHQIRAQLAHKGFPIIGDTYYGSTKSFGGESRIALHAYKMELFHPVNGNHIFIEAPLPDYWL
jgi:23S rRNA pseudouridine1911/1915/1917 synthase